VGEGENAKTNSGLFRNFVDLVFENMWGIATETRNPEQILDIWATPLGG